MKLSSLNFDLPYELFAQYPLPFRDDSRMLVLHKKTGQIEHKGIQDILSYFGEGDTFVFNNSKVFPAKLKSKKDKTYATIEIFLVRELDPVQRYWDVRVEPARKIRIGNKLFFDADSNLIAEVIDNTTSRGRTVRFISDYNDVEFKSKLFSLGTMPLPDYITRPIADEARQAFIRDYNPKKNEDVDKMLDEIDVERFQTVFASGMDSVVVPSSGLHFSKNLLKKMEIKGIENCFISVQGSLGNFRTIDVEDMSKFKIDSERLVIGSAVAESINRTRERGKKVCVVGTEILRAVEYVTNASRVVKAFDGWMNRFIYPPYVFENDYAVLANFYNPMSVQLMAVVALGGPENVMGAYDVAIKERYRFGDYGDAMLIVD